MDSDPAAHRRDEVTSRARLTSSGTEFRTLAKRRLVIAIGRILIAADRTFPRHRASRDPVR